MRTPTLADLNDTLDAFEEASLKIADAIDTVRQAARVLPEHDCERIRRGVISHFETALSNDHSWLGGNMFTLADEIESVREQIEGAARPRCEGCGERTSGSALCDECQSQEANR